jgi:hypothetical protein
MVISRRGNPITSTSSAAGETPASSQPPNSASPRSGRSNSATPSDEKAVSATTSQERERQRRLARCPLGNSRMTRARVPMAMSHGHVLAQAITAPAGSDPGFMYMPYSAYSAANNWNRNNDPIAMNSQPIRFSDRRAAIRTPVSAKTRYETASQQLAGLECL